jgi:hypothetical protein
VQRGDRPDISGDVSEPMRDIILKCWSNNPDERPSMATLEQQLNELKKVVPLSNSETILMAKVIDAFKANMMY